MKNISFKELKVTFQISKRLLGLLWNLDKKLFLGIFISSITPAIIPFINAYIYKLIIDLIITGSHEASVNYSRFFFLIAIRLATLFIQNISFSSFNYFEVLLYTKFPVYLYQIVLTKLANLDVEYFEDSSFKDKLEKVKESYAWKPLNMLSSIFYSFQSLLQFLIALAAIAVLKWWLIFPILIVALPTFINQTSYAKITWGIWQENSPYRKKFWYLSDLIQGGQSVKEIKIFQLANRFISELNNIYAKFVKDNTRNAKKQLQINSSLNLFEAVVYVGIEIFIFLEAIERKISIGDITYFTAVIGNFQNGANGLFRNISQLFDNSLYLKELFDLLDVKSKISKSPNPVVVDIHKSPKIEFRNVGFHYPGSEQEVLNNFSLTIHPGQKVAFVGENGSGKTTLVKLLARFHDVDKGEILIDGINLKELDLPAWYMSLGILFQDFIKYEYSLRENIYFGKIFEPENIEEIKNAAKLSGADSIASQLPNDYNQMLGKTFEGGLDLSTGQWQKVALARGFLRDAPILILDEPTSAIDAKAESEIFEKVEKLSKDKTVVIISHRFSTVRSADKIFVIEGGKIAENGDHEQLIKKNGIYANLFRLQAKGYK